MSTYGTQCERVIAYMQQHGSITQMEAMQIGVFRLASRICDIKKRGHRIMTETVKVENRYGESCRVKRYRLLSGDGEELA